VIDNLVREKNNIIFVPSTDKLLVTQLFNSLSNVLVKPVYEDYRVMIIGMEEWLGYDNIDLEYFQKLNVCVPVSQFVDDQDSLVRNFTRKYVNVNKTYPSKNAFLGFDLAYLFGREVMQHKDILSGNIMSRQHRGISLDCKFLKTGLESGYENKNIYLLQFKDYTLSRIY